MKRRDWWIMCGRKKKYSRRQAQRIATYLNDQQVKRVHLYRCPMCGQFHVGRDRKADDSRSYTGS